MKQLKNGKFWKKNLLRFFYFFCYFVFFSFIMSVSVTVFVTVIANALDIPLRGELFESAIVVTVKYVLLLSLFMTTVDVIRRKITIDRHIKKIAVAAEKIASGDYSARVPQLNELNMLDWTGKIAKCFNIVADELSSVEMLKNDFISNVSHEMKTPIAVMQNYGTLLSEPNLSDEKRIEYANAVVASSKKMTHLVTNILKLNKLENQAILPYAGKYDLSAQLSECILEFEDEWEKKDIELVAELDENVQIKQDPELLSLVWHNLLSNAIKFTDHGGTVKVTLKSSGGFAVVKIKDTGCGIKREVGEKIFDKFYQGDTSHETEGNGLGLALVKRVIDIVGADISVSSKLNEGSTFTVRLVKN